MALSSIIVINFSHFMIIFVYMPKKDPLDQLKQIFNEGTLVLLSYVNLLFTDYVSADLYGDIGNLVLAIILCNIIVNLIIVICQMRHSIEELYFEYKLQFRLWRMRRQRANGEKVDTLEIDAEL